MHAAGKQEPSIFKSRASSVAHTRFCKLLHKACTVVLYFGFTMYLTMFRDRVLKTLQQIMKKWILQSGSGSTADKRKGDECMGGTDKCHHLQATC